MSDNIFINGYKTHIFNRNNLSRYRSGGIAILVNDHISPYITIDNNTDSKLVQFFTISSKIVNLHNNQDIKCGVVYIPPSGSRYRHEDPYLEIQTEIFRYCQNHSNILIFGDYNSRVKNIPDYVCIDTFISELYDLESVQKEDEIIFNNFELYNIPLERKSVDNCSNAQGFQMIEFCKNNNPFTYFKHSNRV